MGTADFYRDKRILIFGASGGLGQELARQLALRGAARLYLSGRREAALRTLAEELRAKGTKAEILPCDVTHPEALAACIGRAAAAGLDGAFIACGVAPGKSADGLEEPEDIVRCLAVNTAAPAEAMVLLCRCWERTGGAHFLSVVTSQAGLLPLPYVPVYAASKAGLNAFGEGLRDRLRASGTALTLVMPGFFDSPMGRRFRGGSSGRSWGFLPSRRCRKSIRRHKDIGKNAHKKDVPAGERLFRMGTVQMRMPSRWSISCWMTSAVKPEKRPRCFFPLSGVHDSSTQRARVVFRVPCRERQPSSASYVSGERRSRTGLIMTTSAPWSKKAMMRFRPPIMLAAMPAQPSLWARSVSARSRARGKSSFPAGSARRERKNGSVMIGRIMTVSFLCLYYTGLVENAGHFFYNNSELSPGALAPR